MDIEKIRAQDTLDKSRFQEVTQAFIDSLKQIVGDGHVYEDPTTLEDFSHDWTEDLTALPDVVVKPGTAEEVAAVLKVCNDNMIPITAAGGRTGLAAGMLPVFGGVSLSIERLNKILAIDDQNLQVHTEAGVVLETLQAEVNEYGLMYPPDPSSKGSAVIGATIATNAGGTTAVKYGITEDYVLDLEVALPNGELIHTGAPVLKNSTGYNLTQLMIGSEGTLGIVTKARLSLVGKPKADASLLVPFSTAEDAVKAVAAILQKQLQPTALEFMEAEAVRYVQDYFGQQSFNLEGVGGHLVIQVDGRDMDSIMNECEEIMQVLEEYGAHEIFFAEDETKKQDIWKIRRNITEAIKTRTVKRGLDSVVPRANMPELINYAKQVGDEYGFQSICFGHAGDGNLHINILKNELSDDFWNNTLPEANEKIFRKIKELGGTLSAEHGVGWVQRRYMDIVFTETELELMKGIKRVFDPNGILNPGKIFPV